MKRIQQDLTSNEENIANLGKQIEEEALRMATHRRDRRDEAKQKLEQSKADLDANAAQLKSIEADLRANTDKSETLAAEERKLDAQVAQAQTEVSTCKEQIRNCEARGRNKLAPFGNRIDEVVAQVNKTKWHGKTPVGPLGVHVKLKDMQWADVMKVTLGSLMNSWAVTDARDRQTLKALLMKSGKQVSFLSCNTRRY
jgi:structural maintenance of chromosomes protein 6